jgi:hypothetical protein
MFSALPLRADIAQCSRHVRFVPTTEVAALFDHPVGERDQPPMAVSPASVAPCQSLIRIKLNRTIHHLGRGFEITGKVSRCLSSAG